MITVLESKDSISISASELGAMSKDERLDWLNTAPDGSKITGLYSIRSDFEQRIEKRSGYKKVYGGIGAGSSLSYSSWYVAGYEDPYISSTIRKAYDGTSKYYYTK